MSGEENYLKVMDYHIVKNLQYQNELNYYIYNNTKKTAINQRKANFLSIIQIPTVVLALFELVILLNYDLIIFFWSLIIPLFFVIIGIIVYKYRIVKINKKEECYMLLTSTLIMANNNKDRIELIQRFGIDIPKEIIKVEFECFEMLLGKDLYHAFNMIKLNDKTSIELEEFLENMNYSITNLLTMLETYNTFMNKKGNPGFNNDNYKKNFNNILSDLKKKKL